MCLSITTENNKGEVITKQYNTIQDFHNEVNSSITYLNSPLLASNIVQNFKYNNQQMRLSPATSVASVVEYLKYINVA